MSFFDNDDEPGKGTRTQPRRPSRSPRSSEQQTLLIRRGLAAVAVLVVIVLIVVGIRGCLSSQMQRSLRDYNRDVTALIQESDTQVGKPLFEALGGAAVAGAKSPIELQNTVNQLGATAAAEVKRAAKIDTPSEMEQAQRAFQLVLGLRQGAIAKIADKLPTALGKTGADQAIAQITGQMQVFLASDVIYSQRVMPLIAQAFAQNGVSGQVISKSKFFPDISWLTEQTVADRLGASLTPGSAGAGPAAAGSHDLALVSTLASGVDISPDATNRSPAAPPPIFNVTFVNNGENEESNVTVKVTIQGPGVKTVVTEKRVALIAAGESQTVDVALDTSPPVGKPVTITVSINPVSGENDTKNNSRKYPSNIFTP